jgi:hypothetical protein
MRKDDLAACEKQELIFIVNELKSQLKKKNMELYKTRLKLNTAKSRIRKMKDTLLYQRNRIVELYKDDA